MYMPWLDQYGIGDEVIDQQHRQIVDMINTLHDSLAKKDPAADIREVVTRLVKYTQEHFAAEEGLMERLHYPGFGRQQRAHAALVKRLIGVLNRMKRGDQVSVRELLAFLKDWWNGHVRCEDCQIAKWMQERRMIES